MALKHHLEIALEWLRWEEQTAVLRLISTWRFSQNPVILTEIADSIVAALGAHISVDDASFELPYGESLYHHYFSLRLAAVTEAILELEELLEGQDE